ncbi:MAG: helix-turn-helix domain-containing protein [Roseovarius sp.]|uniref:helix-turn-helix domain-containing protein n=1 Tax=Roseovarius sp. TaxID=1486281 RepID=UPI0032EB53CA
MQDGSRVIDASEWRQQRWGWLEGVRRDADLSATARLVAHVLALDFVNVRTMRCDPSYGEIARLIGTHEKTVSRAVSQLVETGWLTRAGGIGRSNHPSYGFITRAQIVHLKGDKNVHLKGDNTVRFSGSQKGTELSAKPDKNVRAHNNAEPWKNHGAGARASAQAYTRARGGRVSSNPLVAKEAERAVGRWRDGRADAFDGLKGYVIDHILGAGLLTGDEIAQAFPEQSSEKGESDDGQ